MFYMISTQIFQTFSISNRSLVSSVLDLHLCRGACFGSKKGPLWQFASLLFVALRPSCSVPPSVVLRAIIKWLQRLYDFQWTAWNVWNLKSIDFLQFDHVWQASIIAKLFFISKEFLKFTDFWTRTIFPFSRFLSMNPWKHLSALMWSRWFVLRYTECGYPEHTREVGMHRDSR